MKLIVGAAAAAAAFLCAATAANACTVATNQVLIVNNGIFDDGGLPFDLQLKAQWRVADSASGFLDVAKGSSINRNYPGNYPLFVDLRYSDKIRGWRDGPSIDVMAATNERAQQTCGDRNVSLNAVTTITAAVATTSELDIGVDVTFTPAQ